MSRSIIKQPNGNYAIFSSVVDDFILINATREEYIEFRKKEVAEEIESLLKERFDKIESGEIKLQSWGKALARISEVHEDKNLIEKYRKECE